ncbi:unnamed protein product [Brachionus calyciflorus]|nr:unnamed protein product [Brachionus calyciflorus]
MLIDSHLAYSSIETINKTLKLCEKHIFKGDVFSLGCIIYEMAFLKMAYDNKFKLPDESYLKTNLHLETNVIYSNDLKDLIKLCLTKNPEERLTVKDIFNLDFFNNRLDHDYFEYYKRQVIPSPSIDVKQNSLFCITANLHEFYKPITMKSLKYNQNLIVILGVKQLSSYRLRNSEEFKFLIYTEYGQLLKEFNSYLLNNDSGHRENFKNKIYDFCIDEENNHLYITTKEDGILRFSIRDTNHYLEDLVFDGRVDLSEMYEQEEEIFPTCLSLIEDESMFKESMKTSGKRRLVFYDRISKRVITFQVDLTSQMSKENFSIIKCYLNAGLTIEKQFIRQMVSTSSELICLFDDLNLINGYNLKTLQLTRTNQHQTKKSCKNTNMCLTLDSVGYLYSTDGKSIFNLDYDFEQQKRIRPSLGKGNNLSHTITWITLLTNSKLVLLTDALQMENSLLFILKPVNNRVDNKKKEVP